jgi:hypothetical protein
MRARAALLLVATLVALRPTVAQVIDSTPAQGSVSGSDTLTGNLVAAGLSLGLKALAGRQKFEARDAAVPEATTSDVIFVFDGMTVEPAATARLAGVTLVETIRLETVDLTIAVAALRKGDTPAAAIARLSAQPTVLWAQPNHLYQVMGSASPLPKRFGLHKVPAAPSTITGTIALIDTNVALDHAALRGAAIREVALFAKPAPGLHGTAIASLLVGTGQIPGIARGALLVSFPAFIEQPKGPALSQSRYLARALDGAIQLRPGVINLSFGGTDDKLLARLLDAAQARGICVAAASGNGGRNGVVPFPASHPASLAVSAVDDQLKPYLYGTPGARVDVAGIGVNLMAAVPRGYRSVSGTSFATAVVAGAALRLPACRGAPGQSLFRASATAIAHDLGKPGRDTIFGAGLFQPTK